MSRGSTRSAASRRAGRIGRWAALLAAGLALCACEDDDWSHKPPAGQGSIIVDNRTSDDLHVYLDGAYAQRVKDFDHEAFDVQPGLVRVALDQAHGSRAWRDDVDVLQGKLTVLEIRADWSGDDFSVRVYFD